MIVSFNIKAKCYFLCFFKMNFLLIAKFHSEKQFFSKNYSEVNNQIHQLIPKINTSLTLFIPFFSETFQKKAFDLYFGHFIFKVEILYLNCNKLRFLLLLLQKSSLQLMIIAIRKCISVLHVEQLVIYRCTSALYYRLVGSNQLEHNTRIEPIISISLFVAIQFVCFSVRCFLC